MPFYEYRCEQGHSFDVKQRMADDPVTSCITCEAPVQRIFHAPAVHFKGSGLLFDRLREVGRGGQGLGRGLG
ncbi:MAG: FmdB family zinc ribbon protein [Thermoleophilaceae bacterium]